MASYSRQNKDRENARARAWYSENKDRHRATCKKYYEHNKESVHLACKEWREENPQKVSAYSRARKARARAAEGSWSFKDIEDLMIRQSGQCLYCLSGLNSGYHVDHIMPLALGGSNWPDNLQLLCQRCNLSKGAKHPDEFEREIGFTR